MCITKHKISFCKSLYFTQSLLTASLGYHNPVTVSLFTNNSYPLQVISYVYVHFLETFRHLIKPSKFWACTESCEFDVSHII